MRTPKVRGFKLEVADPEAFHLAWRAHRNGNQAVAGLGFYLSSHVEFGASPIRDKRSMDRFLQDMDNLGLVYNVFAIT
jgi:hypothetical protein